MVELIMQKGDAFYRVDLSWFDLIFDRLFTLSESSETVYGTIIEIMNLSQPITVNSYSSYYSSS